MEFFYVDPHRRARADDLSEEVALKTGIPTRRISGGVTLEAEAKSWEELRDRLVAAAGFRLPPTVLVVAVAPQCGVHKAHAIERLRVLHGAH